MINSQDDSVYDAMWNQCAAAAKITSSGSFLLLKWKCFHLPTFFLLACIHIYMQHWEVGLFFPYIFCFLMCGSWGPCTTVWCLRWWTPCNGNKTCCRHHWKAGYEKTSASRHNTKRVGRVLLLFPSSLLKFIKFETWVIRTFSWSLEIPRGLTIPGKMSNTVGTKYAHY